MANPVDPDHKESTGKRQAGSDEPSGLFLVKSCQIYHNIVFFCVILANTTPLEPYRAALVRDRDSWFRFRLIRDMKPIQRSPGLAIEAGGLQRQGAAAG